MTIVKFLFNFREWVNSYQNKKYPVYNKLYKDENEDNRRTH